tara:strand:+ start:418 stop:1245 length:828 start_codon:yes stop_codon:yes gene_type:complete
LLERSTLLESAIDSPPTIIDPNDKTIGSMSDHKDAAKEYGCYHYLRSDESKPHYVQTGITESFSIHDRLDYSGFCIKSTRDASQHFSQAQITTWAYYSKLGESFAKPKQVDLLADLPQAESVISCRYYLRSNQLRVYRKVNSETLKVFDYPYRGELPILPLMRCFLGPLIYLMSKSERGTSEMIVPDIRDPASSEFALPLFEKRNAQILPQRKKKIMIDSQDRCAQAYSFLGGNYDHNSIFWLDRSNQLLLCYDYKAPNGEKWRTWLKNHRSESI